MEKRKDPLTGEEFYPARYNQVFASRKNQVKYNNNKARKERSILIETNKRLESNRRILKQIIDGAMKRGKSCVIADGEYLLDLGFEFCYYTQSVKYEGANWQLIYEYGLKRHEDKWFKIQKLI